MTVDIGTTTSTGQIKDSNGAVLVIEFHSRSTNKDPVIVGLSTVTSIFGREMAPGESFTLNFALPDTGRSSGSVLLSTFYAQMTGADVVDWAAIIR